MQALKVVLAQIATFCRVPVHGEAVRELLQSGTHEQAKHSVEQHVVQSRAHHVYRVAPADGTSHAEPRGHRTWSELVRAYGGQGEGAGARRARTFSPKEGVKTTTGRRRGRRDRVQTEQEQQHEQEHEEERRRSSVVEVQLRNVIKQL
eukprot:scaffold67469_cov69-Phaeocystis_antarctica.AAC.2